VCRLCACVVSVSASSPPWKPSVGLACMPCTYLNSDAPGVAASKPLLLNQWLLLNHDGESLSRGTQLSSIAQQKWSNVARKHGLWIFVASKASGRSLLTTHSDRTYVYIQTYTNNTRGGQLRKCLKMCIFAFRRQPLTATSSNRNQFSTKV